MNSHLLKSNIALIGQAITAMVATLPVLAHADEGTGAQEIVITGQKLQTLSAGAIAPSQSSVNAGTPLSIISNQYIREATSPIADYSQLLMVTPGVFGFAPNGVGLGDTKVTMRGLSDSNFVMSFDGIPFNDTNGVSHHSWVFFPSQFLGGAVVDRSPGTASTIGQATFGGTIDLRSRELEPNRRIGASATVGTWNTHMVGVEVNSGNLNENNANFLINAHELKSRGYQTYNNQDRLAGSGKFSVDLTNDTKLTLYGNYLDLKSNTPNVKGIFRSDYDQGVYTKLLSGTPGAWNYYGYNFYNVHTGWSYVQLQSNLGGGWKVDEKIYSYRYNNKQYYNNSTITSNPPVSATSAVDKLNSYTTIGNLLRVSQESSLGTLRFGLWWDQADSYRYQIKSDPRTLVNVAVPNFSENYRTTTFQPYVEYEFHIGEQLTVLPGVKVASYHQNFYHLADNGGAVGNLGGAPSLTHAVTYRETLPSLRANYLLAKNWSVYGQAAVGDQIPSTNVFDVPNAKVNPPPKSTKAKTVQFGTVINAKDYTFAADVYHTKLDGTYSPTTPDANGNIGYYLSGTQTDQGFEAEGNYVIGGGFSVFGNATFGSLKYADGSSSGQWVAGAPHDTETMGLSYREGAFSVNLSGNRIGRVYNDSGSTHEAFALATAVVTNLNINYTLKSPFDPVQRIKLQAALNNLLNSHTIVGIAGPVSGSSDAAPNAKDLLTVMPARSLLLTASVDF
jgi:iron complex outermembrane receptor protein